MANFSSGLTSPFDLDALRAILEDKLPCAYIDKKGTTANTSSTSYVDLITENITGVETDDIIEVQGMLTISGTSGDVGNCRIVINGVAQTPVGGRTFTTTSSAGASITISISALATGLSGTIACDLEWKTNGSAIYTASHGIIIKKYKKRA